MAKQTILFMAANPAGTDSRALDRQARAIQDELLRAGQRDCFHFETRWAAQPLDLLRQLRTLRPAVVHICGGRATGTAEGGVFFQEADGSAKLVPAAALANAFDAAGSSVKLVVLDACYSDDYANAITAHIDCVIGVTGKVADGAAQSFAIGFYGGLGDGEPVAAAFKQGQAAISLESTGDGNQLKLRQRPGVEASRLRLADPR